MRIMGSYSRRRLLGHGVAALALAPAIGRAETEPEAQTPPSGETIQGAADPQHRLTVETAIDGKGPFRFLVDTGADRSVVADDVAIKLGLLAGDDVVVQGIARALPATMVDLKNLTFGRISIARLPVPVLPRRWLGADGYLGLDVIDDRRVTFDFQNHRLTIDRSMGLPDWARPNEHVVRVDGSSGRLTAVDCTVDGVHAFAFIDSGAEISIGNTRLFAELQKAGAIYASEEVIPVIGVTGGQAPGRLTAIAAIRLGPIHFSHSFLLISDLQVFDVWGLADKPALFLGMNFLKQTSAVTIDYVRKELRFRLADMRLASRA